jgi:hypothetical protein
VTVRVMADDVALLCDDGAAAAVVPVEPEVQAAARIPAVTNGSPTLVIRERTMVAIDISSSS